MSYLLLLLTILLIAAGQVTQKIASRSLEKDARLPALMLSMAFSPAFWISVLFMASGLVVWLTTLSTMEVSRAYPLLSASFVITAVLSQLILHERIGRTRWMGICMVTAGSALMLAAP
jgi:drug/metabolite transporter (DMT)-like permease